ncbi:MAG: putative toxin-antitoxin system toxin component, PIN family [Candidatus Thiodiazotropha sp. (ex Lucinoma kastoroae)]|nr:putative toxin-antitoxin system toxin component, PIN family [Candidatus Thiodiazotropha sp. (ex Lucinoma kastoroae)]
MQAVLDTNVVVSALIWGGTPFKLLQAATDGNLTLYTSPALLAELRDVLTRDHLARRLTQLQTAIEDAIRLYEEMSIPVTPLATPRVVLNDIDDDQVIACALAAGVELIVSGDSDLLVLHPWRGIQILNAAEAVRFVMNAKTE